MNRSGVNCKMIPTGSPVAGMSITNITIKTNYEKCLKGPFVQSDNVP